MKAKTTKRPRKKHMEPNQTTKSVLHRDLSPASIKVLVVIGGAVLLLIILGAFEYWHMNKAPAVIAPQEDPRIKRLEELEASSKPVTATPTERTAQLQKLQASSKPVKATEAQRIAKLEALEKSSH